MPCWFLPQISHNSTYKPPSSHLPLQVIRERQAGFPVLHDSLSPLSVLHTAVYVYQYYFLHSSHSFLPLLCPQSVL